ncbi:MAG: branched-chain amino acid ABC transporter permease [Euzebyales bacterium]|nr:branched-chain amino acid ABC transporter permease [Euzebyales bacterium]MBA3621645.1 branched-chain amino acid ABC transporter permease [Euzebyales bacterium]
MSTRRKAGLALAVLVALAAFFAPHVLSGYQLVFAVVLLLYVGLAYSWNLISGYTGYLSFGHVAFFGIGAYAVGVLSRTHGWHWIPAVAVGGLLAAGVALPLGMLMLRLRGPYFAIGMLAVAEATRLLASVWDGVTRGGLGIFVSATYNVFSVYYAMLAVVLAVMGLTWWINNSTWGLRLLSIRDDENAAEALGIDTTREKLRAFVMSAAFPGLIGGLYAWYIGYIDPESVFAINFSTNMILMTLLGGAGTFLGPLIGGVVFAFVLETLWATFPAYHLIATGLAIVAIVLFLPRGLVDVGQRLGILARRRAFVAGLGRTASASDGPATEERSPRAPAV